MLLSKAPWRSWVWEEHGDAGRYYVECGVGQGKGGPLTSQEAGYFQLSGLLSGKPWGFLFVLPPG